MSEEQTEETTETNETETQETTETSEVVEPKPSEKQDEAKVQSMLRKFKLKVDGEEIEEEIDLADEQKLIKMLQLAKVAPKRLQEVHDEKKKLFELAKQFEDPRALLERMGDKGTTIAEEILLKKLQNEMLSPEQRQMQELQSKLAMYEKQEAEAKQRLEQEQLSKMEQQQAEHYQKVIIDALTKTGLPPSTEMIKRAAGLLSKNLELNLDLDADDLASEIMKETKSIIQSLVKSAEGQQLLNILGDDAAKKLRKHDIDTLKAKQKMSPTKSLTQSSMPNLKRNKNNISFDEWRQEVADRIKNTDEPN